jgi:hypothetical protein
MTRTERRAHWRGIIDGQTTSGKNISAYCREIRIKTDRFYAWRRRFRAETTLSKGFIKLIPGTPVTSGTNIRILLNENLCIEVGQGFDSMTLRAVIKALSDLH